MEGTYPQGRGQRSRLHFMAKISSNKSMRDSRPSIVYIEAVSSILLVKEVTEVG